MSCAAAFPQLDRGSDYESERHRFESYTPHHLNLKPPATGAFLLRRHPMDSNLGRGASVKKTRSVFSPRASTPAGVFSILIRSISFGETRTSSVSARNGNHSAPSPTARTRRTRKEEASISRTDFSPSATNSPEAARSLREDSERIKAISALVNILRRLNLHFRTSGRVCKDTIILPDCTETFHTRSGIPRSR